MESNKEAIQKYFDSVIADMASDNAKVPVDKFRSDVTNIDGKLYAPDWFQYMIFGRGPGKFPPPDAMLKSVQNNPDWLESAKRVYKYIKEQGLAYLIGRKIAREGTDVYLGKRKGVDFIGAMEKNMPELLKTITFNEIAAIQTSLHNAIKQQ